MMNGYVKRLLIGLAALGAPSVPATAQLAGLVPESEWRSFVEVRNDGSPYAKRLDALFRLNGSASTSGAASFLVATLGDHAAVMMRPRGGCAREQRDGDYAGPLPRPDLELCWTAIVKVAPDGTLSKLGEVDSCSRIDLAGRPVLRGEATAMAARFNGFVNTAVRKAGQTALFCATSVEAR